MFEAGPRRFVMRVSSVAAAALVIVSVSSAAEAQSALTVRSSCHLPYASGVAEQIGRLQRLNASLTKSARNLLPEAGRIL
jgi:hypothetical protein